MANKDHYLNDVFSQPLLTDAEEAALASRIKMGDSKALEQLTKANVKYVLSLAHQYNGKGLDEDDLVSEGNIAMMHAAQKFDASKGVRFVVFATPYIRQAMEKAIGEQNAMYQASRGKGNTRSHHSHPVSIDQPIPVGSKNSLTLLGVLENSDAKQADEDLNQSILSENLALSLEHLSAREQQVISYIFGLKGDHYTMAEIGVKMGLKRERVRQIRNKALRKLHKRLK